VYFLSNVFYGDMALIGFEGLQLIYPRYDEKTKACIPSATPPFMQSCVSAINRLTQYYLHILEFRLCLMLVMDRIRWFTRTNPSISLRLIHYTLDICKSAFDWIWISETLYIVAMIKMETKHVISVLLHIYKSEVI